MKKKLTLLAVFLLAAAAFAGIYFLYGTLSDNYSPTVLHEVEPPAVTAPDAAAPETTVPEADDASAPDAEDTEEHSGDDQDGYAAPDFSVVDKNGSEFTLSQFIGKPIVLNFWASWCPPCKGEMPHFEEAYKAYPDVEFLMINVTTGDDRAAAEAFIAESGYTFPVYYDVEGTASYIYGTGSLPATFFIDRDGNLVTYAVGALSADSLEQGIGFIA